MHALFPVEQRFRVPPSHPSLPGHFPGRPVVPGVVLLDAISAMILPYAGGARVEGWEDVKFQAPVLPGDEVVVTLQVQARGVGFSGKVAERTVLRGVARIRVGP